MVYVKTFKGYEDKIAELDKSVNDWLTASAHKIKAVLNRKATLSHDFVFNAAATAEIYTIVYEASEALV